MVDPECFGIVHEVKKLAFHTTLEGSELETFVDSDESYIQKKDSEES